MTEIETIRQECIDRAKAAHATLFDAIEHNSTIDIIEYAAPGLALSIAPGTSSCLTVQPFVIPSGKLIPGIKVQSPDERTASYLLLDVISALQSRDLDETIANLSFGFAYIESITGYPEILGWESGTPRSSLEQRLYCSPRAIAYGF